MDRFELVVKLQQLHADVTQFSSLTPVETTSELNPCLFLVDKES
jgi:hypothetical protein